MKRILAHRPSPAMAVASIALFVALGGVSYGVATGSIDSREIKDNSIRGKDVRNNNLTSRDLRNNQVRGIDIRNGTIKGHDIRDNSLNRHQIREAKLDKVPEAAIADQAAVADDAALLGGQPPSAFASATPEPVQPASLAPGATALGGPYLVPGFWRDALGTVHLQGSLATAAAPAFVLPAGYRPAGTARFAAHDDATVEVEADGDVNVTGAGEVSLDGISFRAAG